MLLNLRYQFMAKAALTANADRAEVRTWRKVVSTRPAEIAERTDAQAPMAFVFKEQAQKTAHFIRYDVASGGLFLRQAKGNRMEARNETFESDLNYPTAAMNKARRERYYELFETEENYFRVPEYELSSLYTVDKTDIEAADRAFDACVASYISADGWLWRKVPEPVFHLYRTNEGWKTTLSFHPDPRLGSDRRHFHFGLHQYEEMLNWKAHLANLTQRHGTVDEFTSMDVIETSLDGYAIDLEFAMLDLVERFSASARSLPVDKRDLVDLPSMPLSVLDAFVRARRILEIPREQRDENVHADAVALLDSVEEIIMEHLDYVYLFAKPSENAFQMEKWHARPISLVPSMTVPKLRS
jgi:hypothetical protein